MNGAEYRAPCRHEHIGVRCSHGVFPDGNVHLLDLEFACASCGVQFFVLGPIPHGDSFREVTRNADSTKITLPVAPRGEMTRGYMRDARGAVIR